MGVLGGGRWKGLGGKRGVGVTASEEKDDPSFERSETSPVL